MNERYSRQIRFAPIGQHGQAELGKKHVLLVGAGALGTGNAEQLVRAGVGRLTVVDRDYVDESNLQRQQLYTEEDVRQHLPKAIALQRHLAAINSCADIFARVEDVSAEELLDLTESVDLIIDATDNFETRFVINDVAQKRNIPWIYGACLGSYGVSFMFIPGQTPCLNCLMTDIPLGGGTCDTVGVIAPAVQMVVAHQSAEALKWLTGNQQALRNRLVSYDLWENTYTSIRVDGLKKRDCPSCGEHAIYPYLSMSNLSRTAVLCGRDTVQIRPPRPTQLDLETLGQQLSTLGGQVTANSFLVSYANGGHRLVIFRDGRVLVHGTSDPAVAKGLANRYLGG